MFWVVTLWSISVVGETQEFSVTAVIVFCFLDVMPRQKCRKQYSTYRNTTTPDNCVSHWWGLSYAWCSERLLNNRHSLSKASPIRWWWCCLLVGGPSLAFQFGELRPHTRGTELAVEWLANWHVEWLQDWHSAAGLAASSVFALCSSFTKSIWWHQNKPRTRNVWFHCV